MTFQYVDSYNVRKYVGGNKLEEKQEKQTKELRNK